MFGHFKVLKKKGRRDCAAHQAIVTRALGGLPSHGRHLDLRTLALGNRGPKRVHLHPGIGRNLQAEGAAGVVVPDLSAVDAVPTRALAVAKKEVNCAPSAAIVAPGLVAPGFGKVAALGVRPQIERFDDVVSLGHVGSLQPARKDRHAQT